MEGGEHEGKRHEGVQRGGRWRRTCTRRRKRARKTLGKRLEGGGGEMMGENEREMGEKGIHLVWPVGAKIGDLIKRKGTRNK